MSLFIYWNQRFTIKFPFSPITTVKCHELDNTCIRVTVHSLNTVTLWANPSYSSRSPCRHSYQFYRMLFIYHSRYWVFVWHWHCLITSHISNTLEMFHEGGGLQLWFIVGPSSCFIIKAVNHLTERQDNKCMFFWQGWKVAVVTGAWCSNCLWTWVNIMYI